MIDNVAIGPLKLSPGDNTKIDDRGWQSLIQLGDNPADFMLMHYEPSGYFGRLCAAFKNRNTRQYRRVTFGYSMADPSTRKPKYEPILDVIAARGTLNSLKNLG